jgi:hypothetical protein
MPGLFSFPHGTGRTTCARVWIAREVGNQIALCDLVQQHFQSGDVELANDVRPENRRAVMNSRIDSYSEEIDHKTCRSICDAIGERLQQSMRPERSLTPDLQYLMDELRRRDEEDSLH